MLCLAAFWIGDDLRSGLYALALMAGVGTLLLAGGRFDMVRGLRGDGRDEYWERLDVHASFLAGLATIGLIIGLCLWEWRTAAAERRTCSSVRSAVSRTSPRSGS